MIGPEPSAFEHPDPAGQLAGLLVELEQPDVGDPQQVGQLTDYVVEDRRHRGGVLDGDRPGRQVGDGSQHGDRVGRRNRAGASRARLGGTVSGHRRTDRRDRGADSGSRRAESWNR